MVEAVIFDLYNTLIQIRTDEVSPDVWERMALFFNYQGIEAAGDALAGDFRELVEEQRAKSPEQHPEIDMTRVMADILARHGWRGSGELAAHTSGLFRALGMRSIALFPDTLPALQALRGQVKLALVSDAQTQWLVPEMRRTGIEEFFPVRVVSSEFGIRKPDTRLFQRALELLQVPARNAVFVGDSAYRDVGGAQAAGICGCLLTRHAPFEPEDAQVKPDLIFQSLVEFVRWIQGGGDSPARGAATSRQQARIQPAPL